MKLRPLVLALLVPVVAVAQTAPLIRDIASSGNFILVVKADGTVVGWGRDPDGQAARPVSPNRVVTAPITIDLPGKVLQVAAGETTQYALLEDGTVAPGAQMTKDSWATGPWARAENWAAIRSRQSRPCA